MAGTFGSKRSRMKPRSGLFCAYGAMNIPSYSQPSFWPGPSSPSFCSVSPIVMCPTSTPPLHPCFLWACTSWRERTSSTGGFGLLEMPFQFHCTCTRAWVLRPSNTSFSSTSPLWALRNGRLPFQTKVHADQSPGSGTDLKMPIIFFGIIPIT